MSHGPGAVFIDLDRTLPASASGPVIQEALVAEGVLEEGKHLPGDQLMYAFYNRFGESAASWGWPWGRRPGGCGTGRPPPPTSGRERRWPRCSAGAARALEALDEHRRRGHAGAGHHLPPRPGRSAVGRPALRLRRHHRHPGTRSAGPLHRQPGRRLRLGHRASAARPSAGRRSTASTWPPPSAELLRASSTTCRCCRQLATPTHSTPTPTSASGGGGPAVAPRELGPPPG